ncbi:MAG: carbonic anhydrase family protein [Nitritalea sp.]
MKAQTLETQKALSPDAALQLLKDGNARFVQNLKANRNLLEQVQDTVGGQYPFAVVLSCIDSRTSSELVFDLGIGDIFSARVAGNVVNDDILGSMEYAVKYAGSKLVVVLGHTKCGAVGAACQDVKDGNITTLLEKIKPAIGRSNPEDADAVAGENVRVMIEEIRNRSEIIANAEAAGSIKIVGGMYDIATGVVDFYS